MPKKYKYDTIIIGGGAAGLTLALQLSKQRRIAILCKSSLSSGSTYNAQGGVAAVLNDSQDSCEKHSNDTLLTGSGLCKQSAVQHIINNGKKSIQWLIDQGVPFTKEDTHNDHGTVYHLTQEGGHSTRRIIHAQDATGRAISETLTSQVKSADNIDVFENHLAIDLITARQTTTHTTPYKRHCMGAYVLNCNTGEVHTFASHTTVLATGGASKAYLFTSNTDGATGDGIAMAWRAGCKVANMEFNQFHPTCLYHPKAKSFLISEAVRGEGGKLIRSDGSRFMPSYDQRAELAPRDIVARAIDHEMKRLGADCLYLDISHKSASFVKHHFPTIFERCIEYGIDITREPIPVVPAAHYTCGGIVVDLEGKTDIQYLFAIGECACTGFHGANRLASNSLLECIVTALSSAETINYQLNENTYKAFTLNQWDASKVIDADENVVIAHNWDELRRFMWDYVGIVRTTKRLHRAAHRVSLLQSEIDEFYSHFRVTRDLIELRNLTLVSELIIHSALRRKESRGLHYTLDYPFTNAKAEDTILTPENFNSSL
ncbi:MAG: L-aspartate oxidase [Candidatus Endonucleobacter sp. (ex Gigantidas childressi)]|nr:L-aspartate oxidase [Candidatus Endonucleobacter sp. (ex Gigantidas childressi)]